jgi:GntR family transcriptional regulator, transcriptional repressor for pyruvate dehydrogenase complex
LVEIEHTLEFHRPIMVAIEGRNPELAARLMTDHLIDARDLLLHDRQEQSARQLRDHLAAGPSVQKLARKASSSASKFHLESTRKTARARAARA